MTVVSPLLKVVSYRMKEVTYLRTCSSAADYFGFCGSSRTPYLVVAGNRSIVQYTNGMHQSQLPKLTEFLMCCKDER